jgi:hypothetical protein
LRPEGIASHRTSRKTRTSQSTDVYLPWTRNEDRHQELAGPSTLSTYMYAKKQNHTIRLSRSEHLMHELSRSLLTLIHDHFLRDVSYAIEYIQLHLVTQIRYDNWLCIEYNSFSLGTFEEIDKALREGAMSPFHINEGGDPLCFHVDELALCSCYVYLYEAK